MSSLISLINRCFFPVMCLVACSIFFPQIVTALVFAESLDNQIERADVIFVGTVKEIKSYVMKRNTNPYPSHPEKFTEVETLFTDYVFTVDEVLKGEYGAAEIAISQVGGFDRGDLLFPSTSYFLSLGEQYVVVMVKSAVVPGMLVAASGGQGVYSQYIKDGVTFLRNHGTNAVISRSKKTPTETEGDMTMAEFLIKVKGESDDH